MFVLKYILFSLNFNYYCIKNKIKKKDLFIIQVSFLELETHMEIYLRSNLIY
jgi:hypothetical protein